MVTLVRQRLHALVLGYEDLNDHQTLRHDAGLQTAASSSSALASPSTLCRLEQGVSRSDAIGLHKVLFAQFVKAHRRRPKRLILDFDATDIALHGEQEERFFHGYHDHYCYLPLYVFCGRHLLAACQPSTCAGHLDQNAREVRYRNLLYTDGQLRFDGRGRRAHWLTSDSHLLARVCPWGRPSRHRQNKVV